MIRPAHVEDSDAITALELECQGPDAWSAWLVADGVAGTLPTVRYLVAERDGAIVGYAVASVGGDIAELQRIGVTAAARRSGVATALLDDVVAHAPGTGANLRDPQAELCAGVRVVLGGPPGFQEGALGLRELTEDRKSVV